MGLVTFVFVILALISTVHNAPLDDDSTAKPPVAVAISTSTTAVTPKVTQLHTQAKRQASPTPDSSSSEESKESAASSEEQANKRSVRDVHKESSTGVDYQTRETSIKTQTPPPHNKDASQPQPAPRQTRDILVDDPRVPALAATKGESTTVSTIVAGAAATTSHK